MKYITICLVLAIGSFGNPSLNAAVTPSTVYDESISGDLNDIHPPLLTFLSGDNVIRGAIGYNSGADFDGFKFSIPTGSQLVSVSLTTEAVYGTMSNIDFVLFSPPHVSPVSRIAVNPPSSSSAFNAILPLGPETYEVLTDSFSFFPSPCLTSYTLDLVVVPEPSTIALALIGSIGLLHARQRFAVR